MTKGQRKREAVIRLLEQETYLPTSGVYVNLYNALLDHLTLDQINNLNLLVEIKLKEAFRNGVKADRLGWTIE